MESHYHFQGNSAFYLLKQNLYISVFKNSTFCSRVYAIVLHMYIPLSALYHFTPLFLVVGVLVNMEVITVLLQKNIQWCTASVLRITD